MLIESRRLGKIEITEEMIIHFPAGLIGLSKKRRFVLMEFGEDIPLGWLQCVDDGDFGLPVAQPSIFTPSYRLEVQRSEVEDLQLEKVEDGDVLIVTTIASGGVMVTGNLRAPLILNTSSRLGKQIVLDQPGLDMRAIMDPLAFAHAAEMMKADKTSTGSMAGAIT